MAQPLAYFAQDTALRSHPKSEAVADALRPHVPPQWFASVIDGVFTRLFRLAAMRGCENGSIGAMTPDKLAGALGWAGPPDVLWNTLAKEMFIEVFEGEVLVHDWADHQPAIQKRQQWRKDKRKPTTQPDSAGIRRTPPDSASEGRKEVNTDLQKTEDLVGKADAPLLPGVVAGEQNADTPQTHEDAFSCVVAIWNTEAAPRGLPAARRGSKKRRGLLSDGRNLAWWRVLIQRVVASDFLSGRKTDFIANLPWVLKPENVEKILSGQFDNRKPPASSGGGNTVVDRLEAKARSLERVDPKTGLFGDESEGRTIDVEWTTTNDRTDP